MGVKLISDTEEKLLELENENKELLKLLDKTIEDRNHWFDLYCEEMNRRIESFRRIK